MDLSYPIGISVNGGIDKNTYYGQEITLSYLTIDTLAKHVSQVGSGCLILKKDLLRYFCQVPTCPHDYSLIGFRWDGLLYFDKYMPMGLRSAAYICQRVTTAIKYAHGQLGYWSINYLDDFGSAEDSFNLMGRLLTSIGVDEATDKAVPPTTRMEFLGNTVDTIQMTLEVSENRRTELLKILKGWDSKTTFTLKQLQMLIGKLSFVTNCVRAGRVFINRLLSVLRSMPKKGAVPMEEEI